MFCPKCGSILKPKSDGGKKRMACSCGYRSSSSIRAFIEKIKSPSQKVGVVHSEFEVHPKTKEVCPKCGCNEAYYWGIQMRAADEPETKFLKCVKCKHTWRDYR